MSFLQTLFSTKPSSIIGINIGSSSLKIVQIRKSSGSFVLETYGEISLGSLETNSYPGACVPLDKTSITRSLTKLLADAQTTTTTAIVSIPAQASLLFYLDIPTIALPSLSTIIPNEASKHIPIPISEVSLQWAQLPDFTSHIDPIIQTNTKIMVAATTNSLVSDMVSGITDAGIVVSSTEIEMISIVRSCARLDLTPTMIIDFGASRLSLGVIHYGALEYTHTITRGSSLLTDMIAKSMNVSHEVAEKIKREQGLTGNESLVASLIVPFVASLLSEIKNNIRIYQKEHNTVITSIKLCGGGSKMLGLRELIESEIQITTTMADPFVNVEVSEFLRDVLVKMGPSFAVSVGLAMGALE
jgi:type IV pilus assembly protein PilM